MVPAGKKAKRKGKLSPAAKKQNKEGLAPASGVVRPVVRRSFPVPVVFSCTAGAYFRGGENAVCPKKYQVFIWSNLVD
jgi:hypothetical protein